MPDREREERKLEEELREFGRSIEYPPTPDISHAVRRRIEEGERCPESVWSRFPSAKWAAAAAVVVVMASPFFSPAFRDSVSGVFVSGGGAGGSVSGSAESGRGSPDSTGSLGESDESASPDGSDLPDSARPAGGGADEEMTLPDSASSARSEAPTSGDAESGESAPAASGGGELPSSSAGGAAAEGITLDEANSRLEGLLLPGLGEPDEIYAVGRDGVMLVYDAPGLTLTQRRGEVEAAFPAATKSGVEDATVNGGRGYWRSSGVLLWERDGMALRLQSGLEKDEAVRLAESAR